MDSVAEPGFASAGVAAAFADLVAAAHRVAAELTEPQQAADVLLAEHQLELVHRIVSATQVDNVARIDSERLHRIDGHRSVKAHIRHALKVSSGEAYRRAQAARALRDLPEIAAAARAGRISPDHVHVLAQVHANSRIRAKVPARQEKFLQLADTESFDGFRDKVLDWERAIDADGAFKDNNRNHDNRNIRLVRNSIEGVWNVSGHLADDRGRGPGRSSTTTSKLNGWPTGPKPEPSSATPPRSRI